ncbi:MAG: SCO family protein [Alphaproteobacteria bacterium]
MRRAFAVLLLGACLFAGGLSPAGAGGSLSDLAFRPHPGAELPLQARLIDEQGRSRPLAAFFTGKPVVLVLEYLRCRTLCGLTLQRLITALDGLPLEAGRDFDLLAISIDPRDTQADAAAAKRKVLAGYRHPGGPLGMHFLTGPETSVREVAEAVGFPYQYDATLDQYIHPAGFVVATPDGRISRYVLGIDPGAVDLRQALADAARGEKSDVFSRIALLCHAAGLPTGRYSAPILAALAAANIAGTAVLIGVFTAIRRRG